MEISYVTGIILSYIEHSLPPEKANFSRCTTHFRIIGITSLVAAGSSCVHHFVITKCWKSGANCNMRSPTAAIHNKFCGNL